MWAMQLVNRDGLDAGGIILKSTNSGKNWKLNNDGMIACYRIDTYDVLNISAVGYDLGGNGVYVTSDGGKNWNLAIDIYTSDKIIEIKDAAYSDSTNIWAIDKYGVIAHTSDKGNNWEISQLIENRFLNDIFFSSDKKIGFIFGDSSTIFKFNKDITGIEKETKISELDYQLSAFPNPFNLVTNISFKIIKTEIIKLNIKDLLGAEVKTLINTKMLPGHYTVKWSGENNLGKNVKSGVYIAVLYIQNKIIAKKLLLIK